MTQTLNDFDILTASGAGQALVTQIAAYPLGLLREVRTSDHVAWLQLDRAISSRLGFRAREGDCFRLVQFVTHAPGQVGANAAVNTDAPAPTLTIPGRPVNVASPGAGTLYAEITGLDAAGTMIAGDALLLGAGLYANGKITEVATSWNTSGGGYAATGLAAGTYAVWLVSSNTGARSTVSAFVTVA